MALQSCLAAHKYCACTQQPPWNLSGEWEVGEHGELVKLQHWQFVGAVWSAHHQPTPGTETFTGMIFKFDHEWLIRATYGAEKAEVGTVLDDGTVIMWRNGSRWVRRTEQGAIPRQLSWIETPAMIFKSSMCCRTWTILFIGLLWWSVLTYCFPWQVAALLLASLFVFLLCPRYFLMDAHWLACFAFFCFSFLTEDCGKSILGSWCTHTNILHPVLLSGINGYQALGNLVIFSITMQLIWWWHETCRFRMTALCIFRWERVAFGLHLLVRIGLVVGWCSYMWSRDARILYACMIIILGICAALRGRLGAIREKRVIAEDPSLWPYVESVDAETEASVRERFQEDCACAENMYPFRLSVEQVHAIQNPALQLGSVRRNVKSLYHGTSSSGAKGIAVQGFQMPVLPSMFGRGLYFADTPLKSWQFSAKACSKYIIVCEVALGHPIEMMDGAMLLTRELLQKKGRYDSVLGLSRREGGTLRLPEYVVYREDQAVPKYLLEVSQVRESPPAETNAYHQYLE